MTIADQSMYVRQGEAERHISNSTVYTLWLPMLLFGSMGAITWAIRGTAGWGGVDGTVMPGLMWGMLWYFICMRRGIDARGIVFWLGFGLALGGELGYGQYVAWMQGRFYVGDEILSIAPSIGYLWFVLCGIGWAAPGGIILGWALGKNAPLRYWIIRSLFVIVLLLFLFAWPLVDWLAEQMVRFWPGFLFPHADMGLYSGELGKHLSRTVYTNTQNFAVVVWWIAALVVAAIQRDRPTIVPGLLLGGGFGLGFLQSALWCHGYSFAPSYIDWWKMWELNAGFNLGILYALALYWAMRKVDANRQSDAKNQMPISQDLNSSVKQWSDTVFLALAGAFLLFFVGFEYFFWTGSFLTLIYFVGITLAGAPRNPLNYSEIVEKRKNFSLVYSLFFLVFLMFHGGSERAGILLELYNADAVDQYAWPATRIIIFAPVAILIVVVALFWMRRIIFRKEQLDLEKAITPERLIDLMTLMGFIGALSIWPAKIGVIYAFFIFLALFSFSRLNRWYNKVHKV